MGVKQDACNIPLALQHQMLIQAALSVLTLVLAALAMLFFSINSLRTVPVVCGFTGIQCLPTL